MIVWTGFYAVLMLVASAMERNPLIVFYTTYQERVHGRSLLPLLDLFALKATHIPNAEFMHEGHFTGLCEVEIGDEKGMNRMRKSVEGGNVRSVETYLDVYLLRIEKRCTF